MALFHVVLEVEADDQWSCNDVVWHMRRLYLQSIGKGDKAIESGTHPIYLTIREISKDFSFNKMQGMM